jgi:hypothetical protein
VRQEVDSVLLARVMPKRATVPRGLWVLGRRVRRRVAESAGDLAVGGEQVLGELLFAWGLELVQESADADRADGASGGVEHRGTERRYVWGDVAAGDAVAPLPRLGEIGPKGVGVGDACRRWGAEFGFEQRREQFVFGEGEQGAGAGTEVQSLGSADVELEDPDRGGIGVDCR